MAPRDRTQYVYCFAGRAGSRSRERRKLVGALPSHPARPARIPLGSNQVDLNSNRDQACPLPSICPKKLSERRPSSQTVVLYAEESATNTKQ